jgi:hypothetical protein
MGRVRRTLGTPQRVPEQANAADGPFSAACWGRSVPGAGGKGNRSAVGLICPAIPPRPLRPAPVCADARGSEQDRGPGASWHGKGQVSIQAPRNVTKVGASRIFSPNTPPPRDLPQQGNKGWNVPHSDAARNVRMQRPGFRPTAFAAADPDSLDGRLQAPVDW